MWNLPGPGNKLNHWTTRKVLEPTLDWGCVWVKWKVKHSWTLETAFAVNCARPPPKLDLSPRQSLSSQGLGRWDLDLELLLKAYQVCIWACPFLAPLPPLPFS